MYKDSVIKINTKEIKYIELNLDQIDPEIIYVIRNGKKLTFPAWEFWQTLARYDHETKIKD